MFSFRTQWSSFQKQLQIPLRMRHKKQRGFFIQSPSWLKFHISSLSVFVLSQYPLWNFSPLSRWYHKPCPVQYSNMTFWHWILQCFLQIRVNKTIYVSMYRPSFKLAYVQRYIFLAIHYNTLVKTCNKLTSLSYCFFIFQSDWKTLLNKAWHELLTKDSASQNFSAGIVLLLDLS